MNTPLKPFTFSITDNIRTAWATFKRHAWFYVGITIIMGLLNIPDSLKEEQHIVLTIAISIVSIVFSYMLLSIFLRAVDGKDEVLRFSALRTHLPTFHQFLMIIEIGILVGLAVLGGLVLLIIPGIYILVRFSLAQFAYIDRNGRAINALRYSWKLVTKDVFWTVLLTLLTAIVLIVVGAVFFGIGLLVTYPIAMLLIAQLYRALTLRSEITEPVIVAGDDIPADIPVIEVA